MNTRLLLVCGMHASLINYITFTEMLKDKLVVTYSPKDNFICTLEEEFICTLGQML